MCVRHQQLRNRNETQKRRRQAQLHCCFTVAFLLSSIAVCCLSCYLSTKEYCQQHSVHRNHFAFVATAFILQQPSSSSIKRYHCTSTSRHFFRKSTTHQQQKNTIFRLQLKRQKQQQQRQIVPLTTTITTNSTFANNTATSTPQQPERIKKKKYKQQYDATNTSETIKYQEKDVVMTTRKSIRNINKKRNNNRQARSSSSNTSTDKYPRTLHEILDANMAATTNELKEEYSESTRQSYPDSVTSSTNSSISCDDKDQSHQKTSKETLSSNNIEGWIVSKAMNIAKSSKTKLSAAVKSSLFHSNNHNNRSSTKTVTAIVPLKRTETSTIRLIKTIISTFQPLMDRIEQVRRRENQSNSITSSGSSSYTTNATKRRNNPWKPRRPMELINSTKASFNGTLLLVNQTIDKASDHNLAKSLVGQQQQQQKQQPQQQQIRRLEDNTTNVKWERLYSFVNRTNYQITSIKKEMKELTDRMVQIALLKKNESQSSTLTSSEASIIIEAIALNNNNMLPKVSNDMQLLYDDIRTLQTFENELQQTKQVLDGTKQGQRQQQIQKVTKVETELYHLIYQEQIAKKLYDDAIENTKRYRTNYQNISEQLRLLEEKYPHLLLVQQQQDENASSGTSTGRNTNETSSSPSFQQKDACMNVTSIKEQREIVRKLLLESLSFLSSSSSPLSPSAPSLLVNSTNMTDTMKCYQPLQ